MNYKVYNVYTEESKNFNTIEEAKNFTLSEIERLNKGDRHSSWEIEDFIVYKFNA